MSLHLPPPRTALIKPENNPNTIDESNDSIQAEETNKVTKKSNLCNAPCYEERIQLAQNAAKDPKLKSQIFMPRRVADFDDGGAFPEIPIAQYPRQMGNPRHAHKLDKPLNSGPTVQLSGRAQADSSLLNVQVDEKGKTDYSGAIVARKKNQKVYHKHSHLVPLEVSGRVDAETTALPTEDEIQSTAEKTRAALQLIVDEKVQLAKPAGSAIVNAATSLQSKTEFISYKADPNAPGYNPNCSTRVIQMVDAQIDPLEPSRFKAKKIPRGPAEDPVPVLHSAPKKLTKEERDAWNIPACISNWKNTRGYTIPLDKRLAADGRNLVEHSINPDFANFAESLYVAERQAREEVSMRAKVRAKLAEQDVNRREEELRQLAQQARAERQLPSSSSGTNNNNESHGHYGPSKTAVVDYSDSSSDEENENNSRGADLSGPIDKGALVQREKLRMERKRQHEKDLRLENTKRFQSMKRLEEERDVSEKIALGVQTGVGGGAGGVDGRLHAAGGEGMDSGFGADDEYNTYSKPLFESVASNIYKPTKGDGTTGGRGPVAFEKES